MRSARRLIKTELVLPPSKAGRAAVIGGLVVGGTVALAMGLLVGIFLLETFRSRV